MKLLPTEALSAGPRYAASALAPTREPLLEDAKRGQLEELAPVSRYRPVSKKRAAMKTTSGYAAKKAPL